MLTGKHAGINNSICGAGKKDAQNHTNMCVEGIKSAFVHLRCVLPGKNAVEMCADGKSDVTFLTAHILDSSERKINHSGYNF